MKRLPLPNNSNKSTNTFTTYSGFSVDQVISSLQKSVRRCHIEYDLGIGLPIPANTTFDEALQWGLEMYLTSGEVDRITKAKRTNVWNRIFVIAMEDIGPSNPHLLINLQLLRDADSPINLAKGIILLLNSKKCRVSDWSLHIPIPLSSSLPVEDLVYSCNEYKKEDNFSGSLYCLLAIIRSKELNNILFAYLNLFPSNEYTSRIYFILTKYKKVELAMLTVSTLFHLWYFDLLPTDIQLLLTITDEDAQIIVDRYKIHKDLVGIPDCAIDKHTGLGKKWGRGLPHFLDVGAILYNRDVKWMELDDYYLQCIRDKN